MLPEPPKLNKGDTVALLAASSPLDEGSEHLLAGATALLESWGLEAYLPEGLDKRHHYFAGEDADRARALQDAYLDPKIKAIFFTRGGYGAPRLYSHINSARIADIRKIVVGYSDVTSLLILFQKVCEMVVYHGPNLATERMLSFSERDTSQTSLHDHLFLDNCCPSYEVIELRTGSAQGEIVGGNLTRVVGTIGTKYELETEGRILFLEDVGKGPQQIDAMVTHLRNAGKLDAVKGMVFGDMSGCRQVDILWEVMRDLFRSAPFPVVSGLPSGHGRICQTLPMGRCVNLDAGTGRLIFLEDRRAS